MKFYASAILAALASLVAAQEKPNPFNIPTTGLTASAGQSVTLTWNPTTQGTVSLILRAGASSALTTVDTIAQSIPNSGSYTWSVPSDVVRGSDYSVEIVSDANRDQTNFTPQFVIDSTNTVPRTTASSSGSVSVTRTGSTSGTASTTGTTSTTGTASTTGTTSTTGTASTTGTSSRNTASSSGAGFQSSSSSAAGQSTGSAPRATAAAGMMGLIALGAMAL